MEWICLVYLGLFNEFYVIYESKSIGFIGKNLRRDGLCPIGCFSISNTFSI